MLFPLVLILVSVLALPPCSLNGIIDSSGSCLCDPGWTSETCGELKLLPAAPLTDSTQVYFHPSNGGASGGGYIDNSWGISVLPDDSGKLFHGYMTELEGNCSLSSYSTTSRILHLTSPSPLGPWSLEGIALNAFAHNPQVVRDTDGAWLLFHIGIQQPPVCNPRCVNGKIYNTTGCTSSAKGTSVARSPSPYGPWERVPFILPNNETNPSALVLANGSILLTARRWEGGVPMYTAPSWRGPYTLLPLVPVVPVGTGNPGAFDEDPYLFRNDHGWHILTHRQSNGTSCSPTDPKTECRCQGGHMYAEDPIAGPWFFDLKPLFNCSVNIAGSQDPLRLWARQRPTLLFRRAAPNMSPCPLLLYTGASTDPVSQYYSSFTMVQEIYCGAN